MDNVVVEPGEDGSRVVIAFTAYSGGGEGSVRGPAPYDFLRVTESLRCSRILCRDPDDLWYHGGLGAGSFEALVEYVREQVRALAPRVVVVTGTSAGGYAAILCGHFLRADIVHAFGPSTSLRPDVVKQDLDLGNRKGIQRLGLLRRLWASDKASWKLFDLATVLRDGNGHTRYRVHYCSGSHGDRTAAKRLEKIPGVELIVHDCDDHLVVVHLVRRFALMPLLSEDADDSDAT